MLETVRSLFPHASVALRDGGSGYWMGGYEVSYGDGLVDVVYYHSDTNTWSVELFFSPDPQDVVREVHRVLRVLAVQKHAALMRLLEDAPVIPGWTLTKEGSGWRMTNVDNISLFLAGNGKGLWLCLACAGNTPADALRKALKYMHRCSLANAETYRVARARQDELLIRETEHGVKLFRAYAALGASK